MDHIYEDLEAIIGEGGIMTHMLPRVCDAVTPWLKTHLKNQAFWDDKYDTSHTGEIDLPTPTKEERNEMFRLFSEMPNPLAGKEVINVVV